MNNKKNLDGKTEAEKIIKTLKHPPANALCRRQWRAGKNIKTNNKIYLAVILVGNNPASHLYVSLKEKKATEIGVGFKKFLLSTSTREKKIIDLIKKLNRNKKITGILLQLPLPKKFNTNKIITAIDVKKDVDGLLALKHLNIKTLQHPRIISPTVQSILHLIKMTKINLIGKKAVILANSLEFAEPLKNELERYKTKVETILFSVIPAQACLVGRQAGIQKQKKLDFRSWSGMTRKADIIIIAFGKKHFLKPEMIKKNAVVIDVGINRETRKNADKKAAEKRGYIYGDVHLDCFKKSKYISPVPGGVGPLTVAYLFKNLMQLKYCKGNS